MGGVVSGPHDVGGCNMMKIAVDVSYINTCTSLYLYDFEKTERLTVPYVLLFFSMGAGIVFLSEPWR